MTERGDRVKLIYCSDPYTRLPPGSHGTVTMVDSVGTVHVQWDGKRGHRLGLVPGEDHWVVIPRDPPRLVE
jgi:hypothetical protein